MVNHSYSASWQATLHAQKAPQGGIIECALLMSHLHGSRVELQVFRILGLCIHMQARSEITPFLAMSCPHLQYDPPHASGRCNKRSVTDMLSAGCCHDVRRSDTGCTRLHWQLQMPCLPCQQKCISWMHLPSKLCSAGTLGSYEQRPARP